MFFKTLFLTFFISLSTWAVDLSSSPLTTDLKMNGFSCETKFQDSCRYQECRGKIPSYSKEIMLLIPQQVLKLRWHFHGHKLNKFPDYDRNLSSMIDAFGLRNSICQGQEMVVFPESKGNCEDFDQQLKTKSDFDQFLQHLNIAMNGQISTIPLHVSAHSGGGRTVGRLLAQEVKATEVTLFDGIYSNELKNQISQWFIKGQGELKLYSIKGLSPQNYVNSMVKELNLELSKDEIELKEKKFRKLSGERILILHRDYVGDALKAHYDIVTETWQIPKK